MAHVDIQHQQLIEVCDSDGVLRLTLNDPATRNSLSEAMLAALASVARQSRRSGDCSGRLRPGILYRP